MRKDFFKFGHPFLLLMIVCLIAAPAFSKEPESPATEKAGSASDLYVLEDPVTWQITRPQITWRLDQKIIDELKLTSVQAGQRERSLRNSIVENLSAEAVLSAAISASASAQATLSLNPLRMIAGTGATGRAGVDTALSGKLGACWSRTNMETSGESHTDTQQNSIDLSFARAISEPRIQFTITIRNSQAKDLICRNLNIPIWGVDNVLAQAAPVDADGQLLPAFTVPANRPDGVDQMFTAKINDTSFWDFVQKDGLARGLELRLERGTGEIISGVDGTDLISARAAEQHNCVRVTVEFPTGAIMTWWVGRRIVTNIGGPQAAVSVAQALATVNALLRSRLTTEKDTFRLQDGVLVSALGDDQYLSGYVWELTSGSGKLKLDDDLRKIDAGGGVTLAKRSRTVVDGVTFPTVRAVDWAMLVACRQRPRAGLKELPVSVEKIESLAQRGGPWSPHACDLLGDLYKDGGNLERDNGKAIKWYKKAADGDLGMGMYDLGVMYHDGMGGDKDYVEAMKWFRKASDVGNTEAMTYIGAMYRAGEGGDKDYPEATKWFRKAADAGNSKAMAGIGGMYRDGLGVDKDYTEAMKWLHKATDAGNADAMVGIGEMYIGGLGVDRDYTEAMKWLRKAADAGETEGMAGIGGMYRNGLGVEKDYTEAMKWLHKAADAGNTDAMAGIGGMYRDGLGVDKDYTEAMKWFCKAADAGDTDAMNNIGEMYRHGLGVVKDYNEAMKWLRKAIDLGNTDAMVSMAAMYELGQGVGRDDAEAIKWIRKAAASGNEQAKQFLKDQKLDE